MLLKPKCVSGSDDTDGTWCKRQNWQTAGQLWTSYTHFSMALWWKGDGYQHILTYLHFTDNRNKLDRTDKNSDRLWKIWDLFKILNGTFSKFYNPSKILAIDKVIVSFKGRVIFKQYIPKKCKHFSIKIFKLCDSTGYTSDMKVYLEKDRQHMAQLVIVTHSTVAELMKIGCGHKYMDNFFSSPELFHYWAKKHLLLWHCQAEQERHATQDLACGNNYPTRCNNIRFIYTCKLLYMFRVVSPPIIKSSNHCICSIWH